jgi:hypothetical protein
MLPTHPSWEVVQGAKNGVGGKELRARGENIAPRRRRVGGKNNIEAMTSGSNKC